MKFKKINPYILISPAAAAITMTFSGCLPLPPLTSTPKLALYYQQSQYLPENDSTWIKRWLPETGETDVVLEQQTNNNYDGNVLDLIQPHGSNYFLTHSGNPGYVYVAVPDSEDRTPRQLYATGSSFGAVAGGLWFGWAPDGKHIGMQVHRSVIVAAPDGSDQKTIGKADGVKDPWIVRLAWSPDATALAYIRGDNILEITDIATGVKTDHSVPSGSQITMYDTPRWMADNRHVMQTVAIGNEVHYFIFDRQNPASAVETLADLGCCVGFENWSPLGDRLVRNYFAFDNTLIDYRLVFTDNRPSVPLFTVSPADGPTQFGLMPSWSHDGEKFSYVKDSDNNGDAEVIIANNDGAILQTFPGFGVVETATLGWAPDDSKLLVVTNVAATQGQSIHGKLITFSNGSINALFEAAANPDGELAGVDWSPNSRYAVYSRKTSPYYVNSPAADRGLLFDTENLDVAATTLTTDFVVWSPDSKYLGLGTQLELATNCSIAVMTLTDGNRNITPLSPDAACSIQWSNPD